MRVCIVGASGKLGQYMVQHALDRGYEVVGVCRQESVGKLDRFKGRITVIPGATDDPAVIKRAVAGCEGVLVVMSPVGVNAEIIEPGKNGFLPRSDEDWEQALAALIERPELRKEMGARGCAFVQTRLSKQRLVRDIKLLYCELRGIQTKPATVTETVISS